MLAPPGDVPGWNDFVWIQPGPPFHWFSKRHHHPGRVKNKGHDFLISGCFRWMWTTTIQIYDEPLPYGHGCVLFSNVFFWDLFYKWVALYLNSIININLDFLVFSAKPTFFNTNFHQLHWVWCKVRVQSWIGSTIERCPDEQVSQPIVFHI